MNRTQESFLIEHAFKVSKRASGINGSELGSVWKSNGDPDNSNARRWRVSVLFIHKHIFSSILLVSSYKRTELSHIVANDVP